MRDGIRRSEYALPNDTCPYADEFAKNLTDLRRSDEIAGRPKYGLLAIISVLGIPEASRHVRLNGHRAVAADTVLELERQRRIATRIGRGVHTGAFSVPSRRYAVHTI